MEQTEVGVNEKRDSLPCAVSILGCCVYCCNYMGATLIHSIKRLPIYSSVYTVDTAGYRLFSVVKFDGLLNVENIYKISRLRSGLMSCPCFQGKFGRCRHRPLVLMFEMECRTDKRWFYDWDESKWYMPINLGRM